MPATLKISKPASYALRFFHGLFNFFLPPLGCLLDYATTKAQKDLRGGGEKPSVVTFLRDNVNLIAAFTSVIAVSFMAVSFVPGNLLGATAGQSLLHAMNLPVAGGGLSLFVAILAVAAVGCAVRAVTNMLVIAPTLLELSHAAKKTKQTDNSIKLLGKTALIGFVGAPVMDRTLPFINRKIILEGPSKIYSEDARRPNPVRRDSPDMVEMQSVHTENPDDSESQEIERGSARPSVSEPSQLSSTSSESNLSREPSQHEEEPSKVVVHHTHHTTDADLMDSSGPLAHHHLSTAPAATTAKGEGMDMFQRRQKRAQAGKDHEALAPTKGETEKDTTKDAPEEHLHPKE